MTNQILTNEFVNILKKNDLIKSGKLANSINVDVTQQGNNIIINVISLPYLIYLVNDYNLTNQFLSSNAFIEQIGNELYNLNEQIINDILNGVNSNIPDYQVIIKYNGV